MIAVRAISKRSPFVTHGESMSLVKEACFQTKPKGRKKSGNDRIHHS